MRLQPQRGESGASAPHAEDATAIYPGTCRGRFKSLEEAQKFSGRPAALRFAVPDKIVEFNDHFRGRQRFEVAGQLGDFVIAKMTARPPISSRSSSMTRA